VIEIERETRERYKINISSSNSGESILFSARIKQMYHPMKGEKERDSIPPISIAYPVENYICTLMI
jgi:hypothetical protein